MRDEGQGQGLVIAEGERPLPQNLIDFIVGKGNHRAAIGGQSVLEFVVTVETRDFFDQIDLALYVKAPTGEMHAKFGLTLSFRNESETETLQETVDETGIETRAQ